MGDTRAPVCCGTACSRVTQEHAGPTDCLSFVNAFYDAHKWEVREHGRNSAMGRAVALVEVSENFDAVYAAAYAEQVEDAHLRIACLGAWLSATRIQACWRGAIDRSGGVGPFGIRCADYSADPMTLVLWSHIWES